ncbi:MAG: DUF2177 family protein [Paracoccaceae bacterium]|jgi:uncharacterized membrane protein|nr:DUF2177 family protein [Paracoccaceae bacterium]
MKVTLISFLIMTAIFLFIDIIWLSQSVNYFYSPHIGDLLRETPLILPAILFYLIYPLGVTILVIVPKLDNGSLRSILFNGLVLGVVAYGTYNLTNMAALKGWSVNVVIVDMIWGGVLTGISAVLATYVIRRVLR